jgi:hypothetical protein
MCFCQFLIDHTNSILLVIMGINFMQMAWELHCEAKQSANCCETFPEKRCETL